MNEDRFKMLLAQLPGHKLRIMVKLSHSSVVKQSNVGPTNFLSSLCSFIFIITDELEVQDEASYLSSYGNECTFSSVLSDGRRVELLPGGEGRVVKPEERQEYASLVRRARMTEFTKQVWYES